MASKKTKPKVCIAIPLAEDSLKAKTLFSIIHALRNVDFDFDLAMNISCDLIGNRVGLVRQAQRAGATHLLFVDHDMFFPPLRKGVEFVSPITKLLAHDKDIVGADYNFRSLPPKSTASPLIDYAALGVEQPDLYKCNVVGTGLMLVKMKVFQDIPEPWFNFGRNALGEMVQGEDTFFCQAAIKAGFEVWADSSLGVQHIGEYLY